ncbi:hypothetical protein D9Q98_002165 [Chlorella vulgaris]|uniref:PsbB mRNA maturation factor Mbb1 n=1 Tax=Chlorella vulgaris TaxID=3077 RepID=A0A9D4TW05_CHLVU|nr:hypothetical protein D9Q98_002165 [Chlorella vulgaris]
MRLTPVGERSQICSTSGRGVAENTIAWCSKSRRVAAAANSSSHRGKQQPSQPTQQTAAAGRASAHVATAAYSPALSFATSTAEVEAEAQRVQQQPWPQYDDQQQELPLPEAAGGRQRDADGILRQRQRPLKINLDLALYHARQKRLAANACRNRHDRSRIMRGVEAALRRCNALFPEDGRPYVSLGKLFVQQRRYDEALAIYEEGCTATGGTNAHIWSAWAYLAAKLKNVSLARKLYDAAIVANPMHAAAWHGWGLLEKEQENYLRARDLWLKGIQALRSRPNSYLYQSLAVLAAEMDCTDEARKWFREGTRTVMGKESHALWQAWALMEQRQGDNSIVRALYKRGLEVSPRSRYTFLSWALWEKQEGNLEEARRLLKEGAQRNPRDPAILQAWALLEAEQDNVEEARRLFKRASKADPKHLYVWQAWGCMEYRHQQYDTARDLFQQGIWASPPRDPSVCLVFQAWAVLERDAGNTQLARELLKCAIKADPKSEPSWLVWAEMEEDLGFIQRGIELRRYNMEERTEVVKPANFGTIGTSGKSAGILTPVFEQIARWFQRYEAASSGGQGDSSGLPDLLPVEVRAEELPRQSSRRPSRR